MKTEIQGVGLGLRFDHIDFILEQLPATPWFELILEDFLNEGPHHDKLARLRSHYPIVFHSVGLNLGGVNDFDIDYLNRIKQLYSKYDPLWISDHMCWSSHNGNYHHDLLPIPRTKDGLKNLVRRVNFLQDHFDRQLCLENISSYIDFKDNDFDEINFVKKIVQETSCSLLLDISNVIINHKNRSISHKSYFEQYPMDSVKQVHLAGASEEGALIIDSHCSRVKQEDLDVLKSIYSRGYSIPAMIERDSNIPAFGELEKERLEIEREISGLC